MDKKLHIEDIWSRSVSKSVDPDGLFQKKLLAKSNGEYEGDIIVKFGIDPTRPDIHLGHAVILRKLRQLQDMGVKVVFLIGDFTALIGDPTGKSKVRAEVSQQEVEDNMATYLEQVGKILRTDDEAFSWIRNSEWYLGVTDMAPKDGLAVLINNIWPVNPRSFVGKAIIFEKTRMQRSHLGGSEVHTVTLRNLLWTLRHITQNSLIKRDMFEERLNKGEELYMHEMLYPVLQGIDSYMIHLIYDSCDLEVGGSDQTFNMLLGRDVMRINDVSQQSVLSFKILEGLDGKQKMSKSLENYISITESGEDMYGKIMSLPDSSLANYFELCTYTPMEDVKSLIKDLKKNTVNPRDIKKRLAREIVAIYHGDEQAQSAEENFSNIFQKGKVPESMPHINVEEKELSLLDLLGKFYQEEKSRSDIRRLIEQGAVSVDEEKIINPKTKIKNKPGLVVKAGKHEWFTVA